MPEDIWAKCEEQAACDRLRRGRDQPAPAESVHSVRLIPRPCSCTWALHLGSAAATWTLTETDRGCKLHGASRREAASQ